MLSQKKIAQFQALIFDWYAVNQRDLPWRHTHDPYAVMLSEVMLQQTQVDRVKNYWTEWLNRWPTFESLAAAPTADVIRAWKGLGYNRRAVNLQRAAKCILEAGGFDQFRTPKELQKIPGIGQGTAGALMNFVWNIDTPFLEVNLKRIFQRLAFGPETAIGWHKDAELLQIATEVLPAGAGRIWPHALMDFGALACRPSDPLCLNCPLGALLPKSRLRHLGQPSVLKPKSSPRFETTNRYWRGQIITSLRNHGRLTERALYATLPSQKDLEKARYQKLLMDLERDGLLTHKGTVVALP